MSERLRDRYEPQEVVGRGGQGEVVKALDHLHNRVVAIKIRRSTPEQREALLEEARTLLNLEPHRGLPTVRDDFFEGDRYYMVMDWIEGTNLQQVLEQRGDPGLPYSTVLSYLSPVAEALDHLHAQEPPVVHQDVKPANLILTGRGRVVLVDLGIASSDRAATGLGTRGFIAPELAAGQAPTSAVDIFSLAATAYALLTGAPPRGDRPIWEDVPEDRIEIVERSLGRALSADPQRRPGSAGELLERLRTRLESQPARAEINTEKSLLTVPSTAPKHFRKRPISFRRPALLFAVGAVTAGIVVVLLATSPWRSGGSVRPPINSVAQIDAGNDEIVDFVPVGTEPTHVAFGAGDLWVTNLDDKTVSRVDLASGQEVRVRHMSPGGTPTDIAADAEGVWIASEFEGTVVKVDPRTGSRSAPVALTRGSRDVAIGEGSVWVTNVIDETLTKIDPASLDVVAIPLPGTPEDVAVGMGSVWVSDSSNQNLLRIDPTTHRIENIGLRAIPSTVTVGEGAVWVASISEDSVTRVDPESGSAVATIPVGNNPAGIAADGGAVWVANYLSGDVSRIDPNRGRVVSTISVGNSPEGVAVAEQGVWVTVNTR